jgi:hypothetical protein
MFPRIGRDAKRKNKEQGNSRDKIDFLRHISHPSTELTEGAALT